MNSIEKSNIIDMASDFQKLMQNAKENIELAAKIYVQMIDKYGTEGKALFQENNTFLPKTIWTTLENIGRGHLYGKLVFTRFSHDRRITVLPVSEQERICDVGVEYLTSSNDILKVRLDSMDDDQLSQVCNVKTKTIRTPSEQKSYVESMMNKDVRKYNVKKKYIIEGNKVHILIPTTLTKKQLEGILNEMR